MIGSKNTFSVLGAYLKKKRLAAGLTQVEVSEKLNYTSPQFISNYERGLCAPSFETIPKLCTLFDIEPNEIATIYANCVKVNILDLIDRSRIRCDKSIEY